MERQESNAQRDLAEIILLFRVGMMTTMSTDGTLKSRPMMSQRIPFDGVLWFFLAAEAGEEDQRKNEGPVNVSYSLLESQQYLSVSGHAKLVFDRQKIDELWNSDVEPWFPDGPKDPRLALLQVQVTSWEFWDSSLSAVTHSQECEKPQVEHFVEQHDDHKRSDLTSAWVNQDVGTPQSRKEGEKLTKDA